MQPFWILHLSYFENLNLANNIWTVNTRTLIFHSSFFWDKTFLWVPTFMTLRPWPWSLTYFIENFNIANNFWTVLELWYFIWVFFLTRPSCGYQKFWLWDLGPLSLTYPFLKFNLANNFSTVSARIFIFHLNIPCDMIFLKLGFDIYFEKINIIHNKIINIRAFFW